MKILTKTIFYVVFPNKNYAIQNKKSIILSRANNNNTLVYLGRVLEYNGNYKNTSKQR